jgi:hypothetical protein
MPHNGCQTDEIRLPPLKANQERDGYWKRTFQYVTKEDKGGRTTIKVCLGIPETRVFVTHFSEIRPASPTRKEVGHRDGTNEIAKQSNDDWVAEVHRCKHC